MASNIRKKFNLQTQQIACRVIELQLPVATPPEVVHSPARTQVPIN